jgi:16S rRNA (adenine1518-N6/adenine1519-N6)-dimethyltransferase
MSLPSRLAFLDRLSKTETLLKKEGWRPRKELGQHFIADTDLTDRIVYEHGSLKGKHVVEVGPGAGTLTRSLLRQDVARLDLIEKDPWAVGFLRRHILPAAPDVLRLHDADALHCEYKAEEFGRLHVVANLPYNISTELIARWLPLGRHIEAASVMVQREVGMRLTAEPGEGHYGRLAVLARLYAEAERGMDVPPESFTPPPRVDSCVLHLRISETPRVPVEDVELLLRLVKCLFAARRKTVRNGFKSGFGVDPEPFFALAGIDGGARAESLSLEQFCRLADVCAGRV